MKVNAREAKSIDVCASVCLPCLYMYMCLYVCLPCVYVSLSVCVSGIVVAAARSHNILLPLAVPAPAHAPKATPSAQTPRRCHCHCLCHCHCCCLCCCTRLRHIDFLRGSHVLGASHGGHQAELSVCIGVRVCVSICQRRSSTLGAAIFSRPLSPASQCQ